MTSRQWTVHRPLKLHLPDSPASLMVIAAMLGVLVMQSLGGSVALEAPGGNGVSTALVRLAHGI